MLPISLITPCSKFISTCIILVRIFSFTIWNLINGSSACTATSTIDITTSNTAFSVSHTVESTAFTLSITDWKAPVSLFALIIAPMNIAIAAAIATNGSACIAIFNKFVATVSAVVAAVCPVFTAVSITPAAAVLIELQASCFFALVSLVKNIV